MVTVLDGLLLDDCLSRRMESTNEVDDERLLRRKTELFLVQIIDKNCTRLRLRSNRTDSNDRSCAFIWLANFENSIFAIFGFTEIPIFERDAKRASGWMQLDFPFGNRGEQQKTTLDQEEISGENEILGRTKFRRE